MGAIYVRCESCLSSSRIEKIGPVVKTNLSSYYCPICGKPSLGQQNHDTDYWYALAQSLGFSNDVNGARFIKKVYELWDSNEHHNFRDFVDYMRGEIVA